MSTVRSVTHRPRRRLAAVGASVALVLGSGLALAWPGSAAASGYDTARGGDRQDRRPGRHRARRVDAPGARRDLRLRADAANTGSVEVRQVVVTDDLPSSVVPDGDVTVATIATVLDTQPAADPVEVKLGSLSPGESRIITIPVKVSGDATGCSTFANSSSVDFLRTATHPRAPATAEGHLVRRVRRPHHRQGRPTRPAPVAVGDEVTFDLTVALADVAHPVAVQAGRGHRHLRHHGVRVRVRERRRHPRRRHRHLDPRRRPDTRVAPPRPCP